MKVMVIGSGGRESAIVRALRFSPSITEIHCVPGNAGIQKYALCHNFSLKDPQPLIFFIKKSQIHYVIVGPEQPLADGLSNQLREHQILVFGPSQKGAQLEASKIFCKEFLIQADIPTARYFKITSVDETLKYSDKFQAPWVLKADGLAAGKGVTIAKTKNELVANASALFNDKVLGDAGSTALLEEFMPGWEMSYLVLTNGVESTSLPIAQDHKRLLDNDQGPNTGGMGSVAPIKISEQLETAIQDRIVKPFLRKLQKDQIDYRGIVYFGLMISPEGPRVVEINVRFGDPEAQVLLPLLDGDWGQVFHSIAQGELPQLKWKSLSAACVVMAASGYPDNPSKGDVIEGSIFQETASSYFTQSGIVQNNKKDFTVNGGRVLGAVGLGNTIEEALSHAYSQVEKVTWPGVQFRKDIGKKLPVKF